MYNVLWCSLKLEIGCEAVMKLSGNWAATDSGSVLPISSSISLKNAYCSHGWKSWLLTVIALTHYLSQSSMWEYKIVIYCAGKWAEEHRNGDGNSEEGMGRTMER